MGLRGEMYDWLCTNTYASSQAGDMRSHLKTHSGEKPNKCNQCDYTSSQAGNLRTHLKTHSGEKSYKCNQCNFVCSLPSSLRQHLKIHGGEKSNKCNQCDFASFQEGNLRTHLKTHSGEKSNKCNQCDFASSRAGNLRTHLKTHSGERSNKCVTLPGLTQVLWGDIQRGTAVQISGERRKFTICHQKQTIWVLVLGTFSNFAVELVAVWRLKPFLYCRAQRKQIQESIWFDLVCYGGLNRKNQKKSGKWKFNVEILFLCQNYLDLDFSSRSDISQAIKSYRANKRYDTSD